MSVSRNYFQKFPAITYNDYVIRDISVRAKISKYIQESGIALLPYTVKENERADSIAAFYYNDPFYAWAIYIANGIVDPYSEWPKDDQTFLNYIEEKYGSFENSIDEIVRYEINWAEDTNILSVQQYEDLPPECKKYWEAQFGYGRQVISYFRRELDHVLLNNRIDTVKVVDASGENSNLSFTLGERMYQYNYLGDVAVKATLVAIDSLYPANTIVFTHDNSTTYDINFESGNSVIYVKSTQNILPHARINGPGIDDDTKIAHIIDGTHVSLTNPTIDDSQDDTSFNIFNPAAAVLTLHKVDFSDVIFASNSTLATPEEFFTYETAGEYQDEGNYMIGRKSAANVVVLTHFRVDTDELADTLLANSHLSKNELQYWKSVNAYDDEKQKNEARKEIFVLDANVIQQLDDAMESILKNG